MKNSIIGLNDALAKILVIILVIVGAITGASFGGFGIIFGAIIGFFVGAMMSGVWFVLSGIYEQAAETNRILNKILSHNNNIHTELEEANKHLRSPLKVLPVRRKNPNPEQAPIIGTSKP